MTASIYNTENLEQDDNIIFPSSIFHESAQYTVISILEESFSSTLISSIQFADFSNFRTIEKKAFENLEIKNINFPSRFIELKNRYYYYFFFQLYQFFFVLIKEFFKYHQ